MLNKELSFIGSILVTLFMIGLVINSCINRHNYKYNKVLKETEQIDSLSLQDSVKQFIKSMNMSHADIVYAQARLESANFTSDLYKNNNNIFGMKEPLVRNTVALGTRDGYSYYKSWQHSIIDYALYQATYYTDGKGRSIHRQAYLEKLAKTYAKDRLYLSKLIKIINEENYR